MSGLQCISNSVIIGPLVEHFRIKMRASGMYNFCVNAWLVFERSVSLTPRASSSHKMLITVSVCVHSAVGQQYKQPCLDQVFHLFSTAPELNILCI